MLPVSSVEMKELRMCDNSQYLLSYRAIAVVCFEGKKVGYVLTFVRRWRWGTVAAV